jgi:hypothetical protein
LHNTVLQMTRAIASTFIFVHHKVMALGVSSRGIDFVDFGFFTFGEERNDIWMGVNALPSFFIKKKKN